MLFREGAFRPVRLKGSRSNHILAYMRCYGEETVVAVAPRFLTAVISEGNYPLGKEVWEDTAIAVEGSETWCEWISGASATLQGMHLFIGDILKVFPVGLLFSRQQEQTP